MTLPANMTPATQDEKVVITIEFAMPGAVQARPSTADVILACAPEILAVAAKIRTKTPSPVSMHYDVTPQVYVVP